MVSKVKRRGAKQTSVLFNKTEIFSEFYDLFSCLLKSDQRTLTKKSNFKIWGKDLVP